MQTIKQRVEYKSPVTEGKRCPHCGGPAPAQTYLTVLVEDNVAYCGDQKINLTMGQAKILDAMVATHGRVVTKDYLINRIYWDREPADDKILDVWVCQLRKKLRSTKAKITNIHGQGWRLEIEQDTEYPVPRR